MNPLTNMKNISKLSHQDLHSTSKSSWHDQYRDSAWIFIGGLPFDLTEGDIICIFSQYGEIVNINLIRAKDTGKSKGFCFLCYEDQRSTILAVDNLNGIKILNRAIRVDHVQSYKVPKEGKTTSDETKKLYDEGCAPKAAPPKPAVVVKTELPITNIRETLVDQIEHDIKLPARLPIYSTTPVKTEPVSEPEKSTKEDKKKKKSKKRSSSEDSESSDGEERKKKKRKSRDKEKKHKSKKDEPTYSSKDDKKTESSFKKDQDKRSERSRSREPQPKRTYIRGVSPSLPKRWR